MKWVNWLFSGSFKTCLGCGVPTSELFRGICPRCAAAIPWLGELKCLVCGRDEECTDCERSSSRAYRMQRSAVRYTEPMKEWIARYKYRGDEQLGQVLGYMMDRAVERLLEAQPHMRYTPVCLVPIPLSQIRSEERGFNQAHQLAQAASRFSGWPVFQLLRRTVHSGKQSFRDRRERMKAMQNVFALDVVQWKRWENDFKTSPKDIVPSIVLVDDIFTTGSTLNSAAHVIYSHVPLPIYAVTLARS